MYNIDILKTKVSVMHAIQIFHKIALCECALDIGSRVPFTSKPVASTPTAPLSTEDG